ncbi:ATP-binding protein [Nocardiopsis sp. MG754419]|uniref:ATP-binding protein n=1 Tax=Nocardiopsis sp. MG754419 TaxID=2259865 RepID=UPI001BA4EB22|nr:ATP-binding protein [Nocardiopsis sp. MG754419]MBR8741448.1 ATP-binding protein [Nocardiopsis sp. MG754419]
MQCIAPKPTHTRLSNQARHSFPGLPHQVSEARRWAHQTLTGWGITVPDHFTLVVTELATNAIDHTHSAGENGRFTLRLALHTDHIRVTVRDAGPRQGRSPTRRTPNLSAQHGRGLALVDALTRAWGPLKIGTGVYAEVSL